MSLHTCFDELRVKTSMEINRINNFFADRQLFNAECAGIVGPVTAFTKYSLKCFPLDEFH